MLWFGWSRFFLWSPIPPISFPSFWGPFQRHRQLLVSPSPLHSTTFSVFFQDTSICLSFRFLLFSLYSPLEWQYQQDDPFISFKFKLWSSGQDSDIILGPAYYYHYHYFFFFLASFSQQHKLSLQSEWVQVSSSLLCCSLYGLSSSSRFPTLPTPSSSSYHHHYHYSYCDNNWYCHNDSWNLPDSFIYTKKKR